MAETIRRPRPLADYLPVDPEGQPIAVYLTRDITATLSDDLDVRDRQWADHVVLRVVDRGEETQVDLYLDPERLETLSSILDEARRHFTAYPAGGAR